MVYIWVIITGCEVCYDSVSLVVLSKLTYRWKVCCWSKIKKIELLKIFQARPGISLNLLRGKFSWVEDRLWIEWVYLLIVLKHSTCWKSLVWPENLKNRCKCNWLKNILIPYSYAVFRAFCWKFVKAKFRKISLFFELYICIMSVHCALHSICRIFFWFSI